MRIALVGFYGHRNAGDDRIQYCVERFFAGHEVMPVNGFAGMKQRWQEINSSDLVLFGGGGLVQRGTGIHASLFEALRPPLACLGISVEAKHKDNERLIQVLLEKASFVLVRDAGSAVAFGSNPKVIVGPDLTFLYPFDVAPEQEGNRQSCAVNLLPWHFWTFEYKGLSHRVLRQITQRFPLTEKLYPFPKWEPDRAIEVVRRAFKRLVPLPCYCEPVKGSDRHILLKYFDDVPDRFDPHIMMSCGNVVAMRLHAAIFACQMGIPFMSLAYQPKNREFCRSIGLPQCWINLCGLKYLDRALAAVKDHYDEMRERLINVRDENHFRLKSILNDLFALPSLNIR